MPATVEASHIVSYQMIKTKIRTNDFFFLTPYPFPKLAVKHIILQLCFNYTDLLVIAQTLI